MVVTAADMMDRCGAELILARFRPHLARLSLVWADGAYESKDWLKHIQRNYQIDIEIKKRSDNQKGFVVVQRRWVVERSIAWLGRARRLSKDYEYSVESSAGFIYLASIRRLLKRIIECSPII